jgi:hypothetical protein
MVAEATLSQSFSNRTGIMRKNETVSEHRKQIVKKHYITNDVFGHT